jgi:hypothetical protein
MAEWSYPSVTSFPFLHHKQAASWWNLTSEAAANAAKSTLAVTSNITEKARLALGATECEVQA